MALLQRKAQRIVALYNNNDDLQTLNASFSFLFGVNGTTDTMNSIEGSHLAQVFDSALYDSVIRNMTDPKTLRARVSSVLVCF